MVFYYVADFETSWKRDLSSTWVWAACLMSVETKKYTLDNNIGDFIERLGKIGKKGDKIIVFFHNLKFDGSFIMSYILNNKEMTRNGECSRNLRKKLKINEYVESVDGMGRWYRLKLNINGRQVEIRDSLKLLPMEVSEIAKSLKMEEGKGEIDYNLYREEGWKITGEEEDYIRRDCKIVAIAINDIFLKNGYTKLTIGSNCMAEYKELNKRYDAMFPILSAKEDDFVRDSYRGGVCWCGDKDKYNGTISIIDANSMYPSVMVDKNNVFPKCLGKYFTGNPYEAIDEDYPLFVVHLTAVVKIKENCIPFLQIETSKNCNNFVESGFIDVTLTSVDLELMKEMYYIAGIKYIDGYKYRAAYKPFDKYIYKWYKVKEEATKEGNRGMRLLAKLFLNNLYGKLGTNPNGRESILYSDENGILKSDINDIEKNSFYIPGASFVTAYARRELIHTAMKCGGRRKVLYMDTDSVHFIGSEISKDIRISKTEICCWDLESVADAGIYIRQKTYAERINGEWKVKACGCPKSAKKNIKDVERDFKVGMKVSGKLSPKRVKGGVVLVDTGFQIKP